MPHTASFQDLKPSPRLYRTSPVDFFDRGRAEGGFDVRWLAKGGHGKGGAVARFDLAGVQMSWAMLPDSVHDARVVGDVVVVMLLMQDGPQVVFAGAPTDGTGLVIGRRDAAFRAHWSSAPDEPALNAVRLVVPAALVAPAWPRTDEMFARYAAPKPALAELRSLLQGAFVMASSTPEILDDPRHQAKLRDALFDRLGDIVATERPQEMTKVAREHLQLARAIDGFLDRNQARPIYSTDVAAAFGVAPRTLHNVMMRINGIPLHHYIRLRRLHSVRLALLDAPPGAMVKQCALDAGFRHLGRFSTDYFEQFGEMPSDTLLKAAASTVLA